MRFLIIGFESVGSNVRDKVHPVRTVIGRLSTASSSAADCTFVLPDGAEIFTSVKRNNLNGMSIAMAKRQIDEVNPDCIIILTEDSSKSKLIVETFKETTASTTDADKSHVERQGGVPVCLMKAFEKAGVPADTGATDGTFILKNLDNQELVGWIRLPPHFPDSRAYQNEPAMECEQSVQGLSACIEAIMKQFWIDNPVVAKVDHKETGKRTGDHHSPIAVKSPATLKSPATIKSPTTVRLKVQDIKSKLSINNQAILSPTALRSSVSSTIEHRPKKTVHDIKSMFNQHEYKLPTTTLRSTKSSTVDNSPRRSSMSSVIEKNSGHRESASTILSTSSHHTPKIRILIIAFESQSRSGREHPAKLVAEKIREMASSSHSLIPGSQIFVVVRRGDLNCRSVVFAMRQIEQVHPDVVILLTEDADSSALIVETNCGAQAATSDEDFLSQAEVSGCLLDGIQKAGVPAKLGQKESGGFNYNDLNNELLGWIRLPPCLPETTSHQDEPSMSSEKSVEGVLAGIRSVVEHGNEQISDARFFTSADDPQQNTLDEGANLFREKHSNISSSSSLVELQDEESTGERPTESDPESHMVNQQEYTILRSSTSSTVDYRPRRSSMPCIIENNVHRESASERLSTSSNIPKIRILLIAFEPQSRSGRGHPAKLAAEKIREMVSSSHSIVPGAQVFVVVRRGGLDCMSVVFAMRQIEQVHPDAVILLTEDADSSMLIVEKNCGTHAATLDNALLDQSELADCLLDGIQKAGVPAKMGEKESGGFSCNDLNHELLGWIRLPPCLPETTSYQYKASMSTEKSVEGVLAGIRSMVEHAREQFSDDLLITNVVESLPNIGYDTNAERTDDTPKPPGRNTISSSHNERQKEEKEKQCEMRQTDIFKPSSMKASPKNASEEQEKEQLFGKSLPNLNNGMSQTDSPNPSAMKTFTPKYRKPSLKVDNKRQKEEKEKEQKEKQCEMRQTDIFKPSSTKASPKYASEEQEKEQHFGKSLPNLNYDMSQTDSPNPSTIKTFTPKYRKPSLKVVENRKECNKKLATSVDQNNNNNIIRIALIGFESSAGRAGRAHPAKVAVETIRKMASSPQLLIPDTEITTIVKRGNLSSSSILFAMKQLDQVQKPHAVIALTEDSDCSKLVVERCELNSEDAQDTINDVNQSSLAKCLWEGINKSGISTKLSDKDAKLVCKDIDTKLLGWIRLPPSLPETASYQEASMSTANAVKGVLAGIRIIVGSQTSISQQETSDKEEEDIIEEETKEEAKNEELASDSGLETKAKKKYLKDGNAIAFNDVGDVDANHPEQSQKSVLSCIGNDTNKNINTMKTFTPKYKRQTFSAAKKNEFNKPIPLEENKKTNTMTMYTPQYRKPSFGSAINKNDCDESTSSTARSGQQSENLRVAVIGFESSQGRAGRAHPARVAAETIRKMSLSSLPKPLIVGAEITTIVKRGDLSSRTIVFAMRQLQQVQPHVVIVLTEDSHGSTLTVERCEISDDDTEEQNGIEQSRLADLLLQSIDQSGVPATLSEKDEKFVCMGLDTKFLGWIRLPPSLPETASYQEASMSSEESVKGVLAGIQAIVEKYVENTKSCAVVDSAEESGLKSMPSI